MNKQTIITILLALVAMAGQAQTISKDLFKTDTITGQAKKTIVWDNPSVTYTNFPYFVIQKVEMTKEQTVLYASVKLMPGIVFRIQDGSYLQANGMQYAITGSDSIALGKWITLDNSGKKDFVLYFKPLPLNTKEFDFLEGLKRNDHQIFGLHDKNYVMPTAPVPAEYLADYAEDDQLAELKYDATPATIHFKALNYRNQCHRDSNFALDIDYQ